MVKYLLDTNAVSDYFLGLLPPANIKFLDSVVDKIPNISVITQIELLSWRSDSDTEQKVRSFVRDCRVLEISPKVVANCVAIRKSRKIKTPDAIIAATALANNFTLITNNEADFINIKGLKLVNPRKG